MNKPNITNMKKFLILLCMCLTLVIIYEMIHIYAVFHSEMVGNVQFNNGTWNILVNGTEISRGVETKFVINQIETQGNDYGFDFALSFAKALLCPKRKTNNKQCFNCNQCQAIDDNNFIELEIVDTDDLWLKKENIEILQKNFNFKPIVG